MAYPASLIAYAFVKRGIEEGEPISQMKLQKMVYFAHGIHLALYSEPLIKEKFQAWKFGPVVRDIYSHFKFYGSKPISDTNLVFPFDTNFDDELIVIDNKSKETIDYTWSTLKNFNAAQLSNWSHQEGSPWQKVYLEGVNDIVISNEEIQNYFKQFLVH